MLNSTVYVNKMHLYGISPPRDRKVDQLAVPCAARKSCLGTVTLQAVKGPPMDSNFAFVAFILCHRGKMPLFCA